MIKYLNIYPKLVEPPPKKIIKARKMKLIKHTNKFSFIPQSFAGEEYVVVNKESIILFKLVMKEIFHQDIAKVPFYGKK